MRIAQVAPLFESVPPRLYGGTERIVSYLTEELVALGHEVTLFASGDSVTTARLVGGCPRALRLAGRAREEGDAQRALLRAVYTRREAFDVIHLHADDWHLREPRLFDTPHLTTVHGRVDTPARRATYQPYPQLRLIAISEAQRTAMPHPGWVATIHHGVPASSSAPCALPGRYLVFLGRLSRDKRVDRAIDVAQRFGMPLKIAAKIDEEDLDYFASIRPKLSAPWVDFVGEVDDVQKRELLAGAYALLFLIDWPEPFGLTMVEAMGCGTPVVAYRHGSVPEVIEDGETGFVVDTPEQAVRALAAVARLDRRRVAERSQTRFAARRMALDHLRLYARCTRAGQRSSQPITGGGGHAGSRH